MAQMRDMTEPLDQYDDQSDYDWDYDQDDDRGPRPKVLWGRVISLVVFVLIAFFLGRMSVDEGADPTAFDERGRRIDALEDENAELDADLQEALANNDTNTNTDGGEDDPEPQETQAPDEELQIDVHTVESGETLDLIIENNYKCGIVVNEEGAEQDLTEYVADANGPEFNPQVISAGQEILLPEIPEGYDCP